MIPAPQGPTRYEAICHVQPQDGQDRRTEFRYPVVAWNDNGAALVVEDGDLVPATTLKGFAAVMQARPILGTVPGGGWLVEMTREDGRICVSPVIAWQTRHPDMASPIVADPEGTTATGMPWDFAKGWRMFHPDTQVLGDSA